MANPTRIELLNRDNFDSWSMQIEALMIKNGTWKYVSGECFLPDKAEEGITLTATVKKWRNADKEARSDLILSISPAELQQVRGCMTSRETWLKLQKIYASQGPTKKAALLKKVVSQKFAEGDDMREHLNLFFDAVDKLAVMSVDINPELLSILLLNSLP